MPKAPKKLPVVLSFVVLLLAIAYVVYAWVEPTVAPPGGNVPPPINVGDIYQAKSAGLGATRFVDKDFPAGSWYVDPFGTAGISATFAENVGIGTAGPNGKLEVKGAWDGNYGQLTLSGTKPSLILSPDNGGGEGTRKILMHYGSNGPGIEWWVRNTTDTNWDALWSATVGRKIGFRTSAPNASYDIDFEGNSYMNGNTIVTGNVGIGDTTPTEGKLVVRGGSVQVYGGDVCTDQGGGKCLSASGGGGAPLDASYIVATANTTLTNERVLTGGTYVTVDNSVAGSTVLNLNTTNLDNRYQTKITGSCTGQVMVGVNAAGAVICEDDDTSSGPGGGVTSVGLSMPAGQFSVSGSPVTTSGTLTANWLNQNANRVLASPDSAAGAPTFRSLVVNDIPDLSTSKITSGTFGMARGGTGLSSALDNTIMISNGTVWQAKALPAVCDAITGKLVYDAVNNNFVCGSDRSGVSGGGDITGTGSATQVAFFSGGPKNIASDSNLYWDNNSKRLGIGVTNPQAKLHIAGGDMLLDVNGAIQAKTSTGNIESWMQPRAHLPAWPAGLDMSYTNFANGGWTIRDSAANNIVYISPLSSGGRVGIGTVNPAYSLDASGDIRATGYIRGGTGLCIGADCRTSWPSGGGVNYWSLSGANNLYNNSGVNVGIGTSNPSQRLSVSGNAAISGNLSAGGAVYTSNGFSTYDSVVSNGTIESTKLCLGNGESNCVSDWSRLLPIPSPLSCPNGKIAKVVAGAWACSDDLQGGSAIGPGTQNKIAKFNALGTNVIDSQIFDNGSGVGIGTPNPGANKLEVVGGPIKATGGLILEQRTNDVPVGERVTGRIWICADADGNCQ